MSTRSVSTTFCEAVTCPGHVTVHEHAGQIVLTDDPARPFAVVPDEDVTP